MMKINPPSNIYQGPSPSVGDTIMLDLQFGDQHFNMPSILEVVSVNDNGGSAQFVRIHKPSLNKTFETYDTFVGRKVEFDHTDILDVQTSNKGATS